MAINTLLSYAYHRKTDLASYRRRKRCGRLLIDSGAFTVHSTGKAIRLDEYAEYLERWRGQWDHAITLDVIGDPVATARNTAILHRRGLPVMPVFTRGGTLADFDAMIDEVGYVCVGGLIGVHPTVQARRVAMLQRRAVERGGGIHALGIASLTTIRSAMPFSADASTFVTVTRFGSIVWFDGQHLQQSTLANRAKLTKHRQAIRDHGLDLGGWVNAGRTPTGAGRLDLVACMAAAYAAADEYLVDRGQVKPPANVTDPVPGPHLYVAAGTETQLDSLVLCDQRIHGDDPPRVWTRHGRNHLCYRPHTTTTNEATA